MIDSIEKIEGPARRPAKWVGVSLKRTEDPRFLTGRARFVDDFKMPRLLHAAILRSPHAHARIKRIDVTEASRALGVEAVIDGKEVAKISRPLSSQIPMPLSEYPMAVEKVHYQGEPVAAVAATSKALAEDALELIEVGYETLPSVVDAKKALEKDSPIVYEELGSNLLWHTKLEYGNIDEYFKEADFIEKQNFHIHRYSSTPLETHGCIADFDPTDGALTIWCNSGDSTGVLRAVNETLKIPSNKIRLIIPDIGGNFGPKGAMGKAQIILTSLLSIKTGKPVKYVENRREHLMAGGHACDSELQLEAAVRNDGVFLALRITDIVNEGGSGRFGLYHTTNKLSNLQGAYRAKALALEGYSVLTNKGPGSANRGIGKPAMCLAWERMMDIVARRLGIDAAEIRFRNFIQSNEFPYLTPSGNLIGSGDYRKVLEESLSLSGYQKLRELQKEFRKQGRHVGIGLSTSCEPGGQNLARQYVHYDEVQASGSTAAATIKVTLGGKVVVLIDHPCSGQGHETTLSQIVADELTIHPNDVHVVPGFDSNANPVSGIGGNFANNFTPLAVAAAVGAARRIKEKMLKIAAELLHTRDGDLEMRDGAIYAKDDPRKTKTFAEITKIAYRHLSFLPPDVEPGLHTTFFYSHPASGMPDKSHRVKSQISFSFGVHIAVVEVDIETGSVKILKYIVVSDHGTIINPMIVEGQIHGNSAHGISAATGEEYIYDNDGQLLTTTFADYMKPTAIDTPAIEVHHHVQTPDPLIALGSKVVGEGGAVLAPAAIANAVEDALSDLKVKVTELPITCEKLLHQISDAAEQRSSL